MLTRFARTAAAWLALVGFVLTSFLGSVQQSEAAAAYVTSWFQNAASPLTVSVTASKALCVWVFAFGMASQATITVSDNASGGTNTYTNVPGATIFVSGAGQWSAFYVANTKTGGATSISYSTSLGTVGAIFVDEFSGIDTSSPLDGTGAAAHATVTVGTNTGTTGTWTTSANGDAICGGALQNSGGVVTIGSAFTVASNDAAHSNVTEYQIQSAASSSTAAIFSATGSNADALLGGFALKAATGGGSSCPMTRSLTGVGC